MKYVKITISGKICAGKSVLFNQLKKKLGWPIFQTGQYIRDYVKKNNLNLDKAEEQNELLTKKIDYMVSDLLHKPGNLIVDGWMSGIMANSLPDVLRILLICDDVKRAERFAVREKVSMNIAKKRIEERLSNWIEKLKKIYKRNDFFDPKNYNLVIDTSNITSDEVFEKVLKKLSHSREGGNPVC